MIALDDIILSLVNNGQQLGKKITNTQYDNDLCCKVQYKCDKKIFH